MRDWGALTPGIYRLEFRGGDWRAVREFKLKSDVSKKINLRDCGALKAVRGV